MSLHFFVFFKTVSASATRYRSLILVIDNGCPSSRDCNGTSDSFNAPSSILMSAVGFSLKSGFINNYGLPADEGSTAIASFVTVALHEEVHET
jgi:hypothetical protein